MWPPNARSCPGDISLELSGRGVGLLELGGGLGVS